MGVHRYKVDLQWTGNRGLGTKSYQSYDRSHSIRSGTLKPTILGSSDPAFRGDPSGWNPEELLLASLSACHQLWYLHLCSEAGVIVVGYEDQADATMVETADGGGKFESATLRPTVKVASGSSHEVATQLHQKAHALCFIANSVNFEVRCEPTVRVG